MDETQAWETRRTELAIEAIREIARLIKAGRPNEAAAIARFGTKALYPTTASGTNRQEKGR